MWLCLTGLGIWLLIVVTFQSAMVAKYRGWILAGRVSPGEFESPPVAVVLSLRGTDPSLPDCLNGLSVQNYQNYKVFVVIDHADDPAADLVKQTLDGLDKSRFDCSVAGKPTRKCSLKCDRLVQAISSLPPEYEIVCLIDADTIPDSNWLARLIRPFADSKVSAVTGNRWFRPAGYRWGSCLRYLWNSAAVVQMYVYRIAWGGSLAIRRTVFEESGLLEKWQTAMYEDVMLHDHLRATGGKLHPVPDVLVVNEEEVSVRGARKWIGRQLLDARLYHRQWKLVLLHSLSTVLLWCSLLIALIVVPMVAQPLCSLAVVIIIVTYQFANFICLYVLEDTAQAMIEYRRAENRESVNSNWLNFRRMLQMFVYLPILQFQYARATCYAQFARKVEWRGCEYQIRGPFNVQLKTWSAFQASGKTRTTSVE